MYFHQFQFHKELQILVQQTNQSHATHNVTNIIIHRVNGLFFLLKSHQKVLQYLHFETSYQQTEASECDGMQNKERKVFLMLEKSMSRTHNITSLKTRILTFKVVAL